MTTILTKDPYRQSVEAASGGRMTVLYTPKGQPCVMNIIPKVNIETVAPALSAATGLTGVHPAFKIGSKVANQLFISTYEAMYAQSELVSQPMKPTPITETNLFAYRKAVNATMGAGWHAITNLEMQLMHHLMVASGVIPSQARDVGNDSTDPTLSGVRADGAAPGTALVADANGNLQTARFNAQILSGSGPSQFRIGNDFAGVSDFFNSNYSQYSAIRLVGSPVQGYECQVYGANNDAAAVKDGGLVDAQSDTVAGWFAIDATTATLIPATATGTFAAKNFVPTTPNSVRLYFQTVPAGGSTAPNVFVLVGTDANTLTFGAMPAKLIAVLAYYGFWPHASELNRGLRGGFSQWSWTDTSGIYGSYGGPVLQPWRNNGGPLNYTYSYNGFTDFPHSTRICYYDPTKLV